MNKHTERSFTLSAQAEDGADIAPDVAVFTADAEFALEVIRLSALVREHGLIQVEQACRRVRFHQFNLDEGDEDEQEPSDANEIDTDFDRVCVTEDGFQFKAFAHATDGLITTETYTIDELAGEFGLSVDQPATGKPLPPKTAHEALSRIHALLDEAHDLYQAIPSDTQSAIREVMAEDAHLGNILYRGVITAEELLDMGSEHPLYGYYVNLDERGEFFADVRDSVGRTIYEIHGDPDDGSVSEIEDGFMDHKLDTEGLQSHLRSLGIIPERGAILAMSEFEEALDLSAPVAPARPVASMSV